MFNTNLTKPRLYELIQAHKTRCKPQYEVDCFLRNLGHTVLRLPPYHCDLNPIELIWGDLKQYIARENKTFKKADMEQLIRHSFTTITQSKWANACKHVEQVERDYRENIDNVQPRVQPVVINIDDETTDSEGDADSSAEESPDEI